MFEQESTYLGVYCEPVTLALSRHKDAAVCEEVRIGLHEVTPNEILEDGVF